jgi:hypothetical protein
LIVEWNGREYDVDIREWPQLELEEVERCTLLDWRGLVLGAVNMEPTALRALFWTVDRRDNKDLKFGGYAGPPLKVWLPHLSEWQSLREDLGKLWNAVMGAEGGPTPVDGGSESSPSDVDTPPPSTTG